MNRTFTDNPDRGGGTRFWKLPHLSRRVFFRHLASSVSGYYLLPARPLETVAKAAVNPIATPETAFSC